MKETANTQAKNRKESKTKVWKQDCRGRREIIENSSAAQAWWTSMQKQKLHWRNMSTLNVIISAETNLHQAAAYLYRAHIYNSLALFCTVTNLPFLSLGELKKNGTWAEASLLPLRDACRVEEERDKRESYCIPQTSQGNEAWSINIATVKKVKTSQVCYV